MYHQDFNLIAEPSEFPLKSIDPRSTTPKIIAKIVVITIETRIAPLKFLTTSTAVMMIPTIPIKTAGWLKLLTKAGTADAPASIVAYLFQHLFR